MKSKTSDLTGPALDWAVAKAAGYGLHENATLMNMFHAGWWIEGLLRDPNSWVPLGSFRPRELWSQGGPIIEREGISPHGNPAWSAQYSVAVRAHHGGFRGYFRHIGSTPLIAAMRCFVASRLGDEVDIPEAIA